MYLSRVKLNTNSRKTVIALASPSKLHGAVEEAFRGQESNSEQRTRKIWRIDVLGENTYLLILSQSVPDLSVIVEQFGFDDTPGETKSCEPLFNRIVPGSRWHFRLVANPTVGYSHKTADGKRSKVRCHITVECQKKWLLDRAEKHGFVLKDEEFSIAQSQWFKFHRGSRPVMFKSVAYEGVLTVKDADLFKQTLTNGLGREKAYGQGMLTVVKSPE